jgi:RecA/RadA recombinase
VTVSNRDLPPPIGRQSDVVFMEPSGSLVVLGTAGSGKSLMAMHRAARLSDPDTTGSGPTLLITYNKALVDYLRRWARGIVDRVHVDNFSRWARGVAVDGGAFPDGTSFAQHGDRDRLLEAAAAVAAARPRHQDAAVLARPLRFFADELDWIAGMGCATADDYQAAERVGRGGGVNRGAARAAVWDVHESYRGLLDESPFHEDWPGLTNRALEAVRSGVRTGGYRHIVIDEAQDLSPQALRALAESVPENGSLTLFADYAQQLYGNRLSWTQVGIPRPKIEHFRENFRNSTAIARLAIAMAGQGYFKDTEDLVEPTARVSPGDKPAIVRFESQDEMAFVAQLARQYATGQRVGVLLPTHDDLKRYQRLLGADATIFHGSSLGWTDAPGITLTTYHSAKGLEFGTVLLPEMTAYRFPDPDLLAAFGEAEARTRSARQLYVGLTRGRSNLIITHTGELTALLPPETPLLATMVTR